MVKQINQKTHGEAWFENKQNLENSTSLDIDKELEVQLPLKMNKIDAMNYYNAKLFKYWVAQLNIKIKKKRKKQIISALMFGHVDAYKKYKEIENV